MTLRVVFMGTPAFAIPALEAVENAGHDLVGVYTRAPSLYGRGLKSTLSPVHAVAARFGRPVETPGSLRDEAATATLARYRADVAVVVAYGLLLPRAILEVPRLGCLNLHASLLPRWRGAAPIHRAVMTGDHETGIAVMRMEEGLDTGPIAGEARVAIDPDTTTGELHDRLAALGAELVGPALDALERGELRFRAQATTGVTYAKKIGNEEARLDWTAPSGTVHDHVRGMSPYPGAYFETDLGRGPERVKVLRSERHEGAGPPGTLLDQDGTVACGTGAIRLATVQRAGRGPVTAAEFLRGARRGPGDVLA